MKERLDLLLVQRGYYQSREKAKTAIMAGLVYVNKQISDKPGTPTDTEAEIDVKNNLCPYVGRGGLKLEKALNEFDVMLEGTICADIGASTGGFTDCMLQRGAEKVYAIDVGYGQLDYKLRQDPRVVNMEKTNVRYLERSAVSEDLDFISIDVSFISLNLVFPVAAMLLKEGAPLVCLVKPQFEAGREQVGKHGIVKDPAVHKEVLEKVASYAINAGFSPEMLTFSPMTGAKGNIEYLMLLKKATVCAASDIQELPIEEIVSEAHKKLLS